MDILLQKPDAFGLDISDFSLKIARLQKIGQSLKLSCFSEAKIPDGIIEAGEIKDEKSLLGILKKCLLNVKGGKLKGKYVIVSLPEEKSFLDVLQIPMVKSEELESTVRFEAQNHIPVKLDEVYFDFERILSPNLPNSPKNPKYQEILIAASPKKIVESYLAVLKQAGLQVRAMEIECLAVVRAIIRQNEHHGPLLIMDFGESRTSSVIFSGKSLRFTSTIPISSRALTQAIAKNLKIDLTNAEKLKTSEGLSGKKQVSNAILPLLNDLIVQIKNHLAYYHSHVPKEQIQHDGKHLEKILLCGGGANLKGLTDFLAAGLKTEVELGNPWVNILKQPLKQVPELSFEKSLGYATALGLALRGVI